jgi:hypothetical protein
VFQNRVPRRIFGPKREEVGGGWRRLHNEELHDLFTSSNIIRVDRAGNMHGKDEKCIQNFGWKI